VASGSTPANSPSCSTAAKPRQGRMPPPSSQQRPRARVRPNSDPVLCLKQAQLPLPPRAFQLLRRPPTNPTRTTSPRPHGTGSPFRPRCSSAGGCTTPAPLLRRRCSCSRSKVLRSYLPVSISVGKRRKAVLGPRSGVYLCPMGGDIGRWELGGIGDGYDRGDPKVDEQFGCSECCGK
jgi:hypothetical protein